MSPEVRGIEEQMEIRHGGTSGEDHSTLISIDLSALLPGRLPQNEVEAAALVPLLMDPNRGAAVVLRGRLAKGEVEADG
ncbi:hypothetical protein C8R47DRAFT_1313017 [Mycena vitilis]|nr:hypothetical protein C8R47DRAFT_1313017 [Mycena vitilis]